MAMVSLASCQSDALARGYRFYQRHDYDRAISTFNRVISDNPDDQKKRKVAYLGLALCYMDLKKNQEAIDGFSEAIIIDKEYSSAYINRGIIHVRCDSYAKALEDFTIAIKILEKYYQEASTGSGSYDEKLTYIRDDLHRILYYRLMIYLHQEDYAAAFEDIKSIIRISPGNAEAINNYAIMLSSCPDDKYYNPKEAMIWANKAAEMVTSGKANKNDMARVFDTVAGVCAENGDFSKAISWQEKAISNCQDEICMEKYQKSLDDFKSSKKVRVDLKEAFSQWLKSKAIREPDLDRK